jgi:anaerobic selenocysteine-containing dehydrogenase
MGFQEALRNVPRVISFSTFPDEMALQADYVLPDHHSLEAWGYQKVATGANSAVLSGSQPVVVPLHNTKATVDVLLVAAQKVGGGLASALAYKDEVDFIQNKLGGLLTNGNGFFSAPEINTFAAYFQQYGGWWSTADDRVAPASADVLNRNLNPEAAKFDGSGEFFLVPFVAPTLGEAGANKPWLQELPDPTTTVLWNTWVQINTQKAEELGIEDDDVVTVVSSYGELEAAVYKYPAIRPDTIAIPFGQGHSAYGRFARDRGINPVDLVTPQFNEAGDLAFAGMMVSIKKTGRKRPLSRFESVLGVYGFDAK